MHIRRAHPVDADAVSSLVERAYVQYISRIGRRPAPMDDDYSPKIERGYVDVAERGGRIVGVIVLIPDDASVLVENVAVDPTQQGGGIGRALLAHAEGVASALGRPTLRLYTNAAMTENLALYARLGYRELDRRSDGGFARVFFCKPVRGRSGPSHIP